MAGIIAHVFGADTAYSPIPWAKGTVTIEMTGVDYADTVKILSTDSYPDYNYPATPFTVDGETFTPNVFAVIGKITEGQTPSYTATVSISEVGTADGSYVVEQGFAQCAAYTRNGYYYIIPNFTVFRRGGLTDTADLLYGSYDAFLDDIDGGEIGPVYSNRVYFDVYINGSDKPSLFVNWTAAEALSPVTLQPEIWIAAEDLSPSEEPQYAEVITRDGIKYPNTICWNVESAGSYSYGGSYSSTYLSIMQALEPESSAFKLIHWGFNGEPEFVRLYFRMNYGDKIGRLETVKITKDGVGSNAELEDRYLNYVTIVRIHYGEPDYIPPDDDPGYPGGTNIDDDGPGRYDPDDRPDPSDFTDPIGYDGNAVLTKTYAVSEATLRNIGQKLWSQSYFNVLKIQNNPIENIVAVKAFPFAMSGTPETIQVGDISFGINGDKVASVQKKKITGSYTYAGKFHNYLDLAPYTSIKINLPYIGLIQLDPADLLGSKLYVEYVIDLVTGQCMAKLYLDEDATTQKAIPYMNLYGQMGVDVPLTSSDRVQTELRAASAAVTAMGSSVGQMVSGNVGGGAVSGLSDALSIAGADYTTQRTASQSPACTSHASPDIFILIERPAADPATGVDQYGNVDQNARLGYAHLHGFPCHKYRTLGSYPSNSFVQVERRTDIQIAMTAEENRMLEELLTSGVYV